MDEMKKRVKRYWHTLGPGLVVGASDDDPSGIATYSQTGAQYGTRFLWLALFTFPLTGVVQEMCARIGIVTKKGLAANMREHFPKPVLMTVTVLLLATNIFNIGADLGAIGEAAKLVFPAVHPDVFIILAGVLSIVLQVFIPYANYAQYLKYLALVLVSYIATAFFIKFDWSEIFRHTLIPHITFAKDQLLLICAVLGTTISPYLFFWQTSQEVEEEELHEREGTQDMIDQNLKNMNVDVWIGMFISNVVMFFIIAVSGAVLHMQGIHTIASAADAASALRPFAGDFAYLLFAVGIIGTGMLAIPVLAGSSAYALSEMMHWNFGLNKKLGEAYAFYGVIALSIVVGIILNFVGIDPIDALIYSAVGNGIVAPFVLYFIVRIASNKNVMGNYTSGPWKSGIGWITFLLMSLAAVAVIVGLF